MITIGSKVKLINANPEADWLVGDTGTLIPDGVEMDDDGRLVVVDESQMELIEAAPEMTETERQLATAMAAFEELADDSQLPLSERLRMALLQYAEADMGRKEFDEMISKDRETAGIVGGLLMTLTATAMAKPEERTVRTAIMEAYFTGRAVERVMAKERAA